MLHIIGINHGYQFVGKYPSKSILVRASEKQGAEYEKPFYAWLEKFLLTNNIKFIFEEWTLEWEGAWKEKNFTESIITSAKQLARANEITYEQIDPYPQPKDSDGNIDDDLRENIWITQVCKHPLETKDVLIIVGDKHCDRFESKLLKKNYTPGVIRENKLKQMFDMEI